MEEQKQKDLAQPEPESFLQYEDSLFLQEEKIL